MEDIANGHALNLTRAIWTAMLGDEQGLAVQLLYMLVLLCRGFLVKLVSNEDAGRASWQGSVSFMNTSPQRQREKLNI